MRMTAVAAVAAALMSTSALAQASDPSTLPPPVTAAPAPVVVPPPVVAPAPEPRQAELPANTPMMLSLNSEVHSRHMRVGDTFSLTVVQDVVAEGHVVIPRGARAVGEIVWRTGKGAFGKSAKMEVALRYLDMNGRRIPLEGSYRQEGEGNTAATVGAVLGAGLVGGLFVTGRSAVIPAGRELQARTIDAIPIVIPAVTNGNPPVAEIAANYAPSPVQTGRPGGAPTRATGRRR